jgi:hypothetical protein
MINLWIILSLARNRKLVAAMVRELGFTDAVQRILTHSTTDKFSSQIAEEHNNINDVINNNEAPWGFKRQRSVSPLSDGIAPHYDKKRQRRSPLPSLENEKDDGAFSTARTTPTHESAQLIESNVCPEVINGDQDWEVRQIIGKEDIDGVTHYLVDWNPTLLAEHSLGHAKELVSIFEDRLRAQRKAKNRLGGASLKRKRGGD